MKYTTLLFFALSVLVNQDGFAQTKESVPAVASGFCRDVIKDFPTITGPMTKLFVPYLEHAGSSIDYNASQKPTRDCIKALAKGCMFRAVIEKPGTWRSLRQVYELIRSNPIIPTPNDFTPELRKDKGATNDVQCQKFPYNDKWNPSIEGLPYFEHEWESLPLYSPTAAPIPNSISPGMIETWLAYLTFLQAMVAKYASALTIIAVGAIVVAAIAAIPASAGFSLAGAMASIVAILIVYSTQFTPDEKKQFDKIRNEVAQVDTKKIDVKIDEKNQLLIIDHTEIAIVKDGDDTKTEIRKQGSAKSALNFMENSELTMTKEGKWINESPTACTKGHIDKDGKWINGGGC